MNVAQEFLAGFIVASVFWLVVRIWDTHQRIKWHKKCQGKLDAITNAIQNRPDKQDGSEKTITEDKEK